MTRKAKLAVIAVLVTISVNYYLGSVEAKPMQKDVYDGWRLGVQAWSFNKFTFYEAVDKTKAAGLRYIEAYPGQSLSSDKPGAKMHHLMPARLRTDVKAKLAEAGVKVVNYGVVALPNDEAKCRQVFDFAKDMGIETIVSEPPEEAFDIIDKLCREYKINIAIHNHPEPSHYWNPDTVLKVCKGRSKYIGSCADTGHWMRSGINPIEALKKLKGRIKSFHFKDLNEFGNKDAHDVVWGTGVADVKGMLAELDRQGFRGVFSAEYEYNWNHNVADIKKSGEYFRMIAAGLSHAEYKNLFNNDLSNAVMKPGSWGFDSGGVLASKAAKGHGLDLWTKERYGNFILQLDFKVPEGGNSGVFIRTGSIEHWLNTATEVQIHSSTDGSPHGQCGAIYDCLSPAKMAVKPAGEWNHYVITCIDSKIYVNLNGEDIIDMDLDLWTQPHKNPDGSPNKFNTAYKDMPREGHIGLQYHGNPIWFKDLRIEPLD